MTMKNEQDSKSPAIPPLPPATGSAELPHEYAYSHETPSRKLWDEDDMRDYAAAVLKDANDMCRSAMQIALRDGKETNWPAFRAQLEASLKRQHAIMYPPNIRI